jgi:hypothetical protein
MITIVAPSSAFSLYQEANAQPMVAHRNLLAEGTITNASLPSGAPRADAVTEDTSEYWLPTGAETADLCFIAAHTLGTEGESLSVQYYDGSTWQTIATISPDDDQPFMVVFPSRSAAQWGISITGAAQIGVAWIGPRVIIPGGVVPDYTPIWASTRITKFPGVTRRGHFRGQRIERAGASISAQFMPLEYDFAHDTLADFRDRYNNGRAFIWASAPSVFPTDVAYAWAPDDAIFAPSIQAGGELVNLSLTMECFVYA